MFMKRGTRRMLAGGALLAIASGALVAAAARCDLAWSWRLPDRERSLGIRRGALEWRDSLFGSISVTSGGSDAVFVPAELLEPRMCWWLSDISGPFAEGYAVPVWPLGVAGAVAFAWGLRRRAAIKGCCGRCGYDLSGVPPGACPECGEG
jgi:hypothetical protein